MQSTRINYTNRQLIKLLWPLILEQFLSLAVGMADSIMVAQISDAAVSGVSLVDSIMVFLIFVFSATALGGAAVCGQYFGGSNDEMAKNAGHHLIVLLLIMAGSFIALLYGFRNFIIMKLFGKIEPAVMDATRTYYTIVMASVPGIALYNGSAALFRMMGKTDTSLKISLIMNGINVTGNAILIFGLKMGVEGVAIPTLVSHWSAALIAVCLLLNSKYKLSLSGITRMKIHPQIFKNILALGLPNGAENGMFQLGKIALHSYISTLGTASIAANAVSMVLTNFHVMCGFGVNQAVTIVVSRCIGAGEFDNAKHYFKKLLKWSYITNAVWIGVLTVTLPVILRAYGLSAEATSIANKVVLLHAATGAVIWSVGFVTPTFLRAAGDTRFTLIWSTISMWFGRVFCGIVFSKLINPGLLGIMIAHTLVDWNIRSVVFLIRYKSEKWKSKRIKQ